jgi:hypothetical protein
MLPCIRAPPERPRFSLHNSISFGECAPHGWPDAERPPIEGLCAGLVWREIRSKVREMSTTKKKRGRKPLPGVQNTQVVMTTVLLQRLDTEAQNLNISRSLLIRLACENYLKSSVKK